MSFQLAEMYVDILTRGDTQVMQKLAAVKGAATGVNTAVHTEKKVEIETGKATEGMNALGETVGMVEERLLALNRIELGLLLKLGTIAGAAALIGAGVSHFAKESDDLKIMGERFRMAGQNAEESVAKVQEFSEKMLSLGVAESETRGMITKGLARGFSLEQAMGTAEAAHGLAAATGDSVQRTERLLNLYQEMGGAALRRIDAFKAMIRQGASEVEIQEKLNKLIREGKQLAEFKRDNTFTGVMTQLWVAFEKIISIVGKVFGPAILADISRVARVFSNIVSIIDEWLNHMPAVVQWLGRIVGWGLLLVTVVGVIKGLALAFGGLNFVMTALGPILSMLTTKWWAYWIAKLGPIALVIGLIAAVIAGLTALISKLTTGSFGGIFEWIGEKASKLSSMLGKKAKEVISGGAGGGGEKDFDLTPGFTKKSSFEAIDKLWKDVALAGVEGGTKNLAESQLHATEKTNQILTEISANGLPVTERDPRPVQPR